MTLTKSDGTIWSSQAQLGRNEILLVVFGQSPDLVGKGSSPVTVLNSVVRATNELRKAQVETVVVSTAVGIDLKGIDRQFDALLCDDNTGSIERLFHPAATVPTLIGIDRAGFLRVLDSTESFATIKDSMLQAMPCTPKFEVGNLAPDFAIPDMNRRMRSLSDMRGRKNVLLTFFPKTFTGGCCNHLASLQNARSALRDEDTEIWAVSVDPAAGEKGQIEFAAFLGLKFPLIPDTGRNLSFLYNVVLKHENRAWRRTILIDKEGKVRFVDKNIDVFTHGSDMLAKVNELDMSGN